MNKINIKILDQPIEKLSTTDLEIQKIINNEPSKVINMNIKELSEHVYCSPATLSRFVKKFGFKNFQAFIIFLNKSYLINKKMFSKMDASDVVNQVILSARYSVENIITDKNKENIEEMIPIIKKANRISIIGIGSSHNACEELSTNLSKINISSYTSKDFHKTIAFNSNLNEKDLIIIFSSRSTNEEIQFIVNLGLSTNTKIILITANSKTPLVHKVNKTIIHGNETQEVRVAALSSKISQNIIADIIFRSIIFSNIKYLDILHKTHKTIADWNQRKKQKTI